MNHLKPAMDNSRLIKVQSLLKFITQTQARQMGVAPAKAAVQHSVFIPGLDASVSEPEI